MKLIQATMAPLEQLFCLYDPTWVWILKLLVKTAQGKPYSNVGGKKKGDFVGMARTTSSANSSFATRDRIKRLSKCIYV